MPTHIPSPYSVPNSTTEEDRHKLKELFENGFIQKGTEELFFAPLKTPRLLSVRANIRFSLRGDVESTGHTPLGWLLISRLLSTWFVLDVT